MRDKLSQAGGNAAFKHARWAGTVEARARKVTHRFGAVRGAFMRLIPNRTFSNASLEVG
jgi:hypothetical protein